MPEDCVYTETALLVEVMKEDEAAARARIDHMLVGERIELVNQLLEMQDFLQGAMCEGCGGTVRLTSRDPLQALFLTYEQDGGRHRFHGHCAPEGAERA